MPPRQVLAFGQQAVGAGRRQPAERGDVAGVELLAVRHVAAALGIARAAAGAEVEQTAGNVGVADLAGDDVFQLLEAALAAAVAQLLPLLGRHLGEQPGLPEWLHFGRRLRRRHRRWHRARARSGDRLKLGWLGHRRRLSFGHVGLAPPIIQETPPLFNDAALPDRAILVPAPAKHGRSGGRRSPSPGP